MTHLIENVNLESSSSDCGDNCSYGCDNGCYHNCGDNCGLIGEGDGCAL